MTQTNEPPSSHPSADEALLYGAAAQSAEDEGDDEGQGSQGGKTGGETGGGVAYRQPVDPFLEFTADKSLSDDENALNTLGKLSISPMSSLSPGASAFASENDLSRKVFMAGVGLYNLEIQPRDIASSALIKVLDERQAERRRIFGIQTLDEIVSGALGAAGMMVGAVTASVVDYVKDKREERRVQRHIREYEDGKEVYALDEEEYAESEESLQIADFPVQEAGDAAASMSGYFNIKASQKADNGVESIHLKKKIRRDDGEKQGILPEFQSFDNV